MELAKKDSGVVSLTSNVKVKLRKRKPIVLEEEDYLKGLDKIIQRDFFPDLDKLRTQNEYLSAVELNDVAKIRKLQMQFSVQRTDASTPGLASVRSASSYGGKVVQSQASKDDITNTNLDTYLSKCTSEDNASFEELMESQRQERIEKKQWMYGPELENSKIASSSKALCGADEQLMLTAPSITQPIDSWTYKAENSVMFVPDGVEWTREEENRRAQLAKRKIVHKNTRLEEDPHASVVAKVELPPGHVAQIGFKDPMQQFSHVATPSPVPGFCESPLMTWGEIDGTPFRLDGNETPIRRTPGPNFKVPDVPLRDKVAMSMADDISKKSRQKKLAAKKLIMMLNKSGKRVFS